MTDDVDYDIDEAPEDARDWFERDVATRGMRIAYEALLGVCLDPKAPAPAKSSAGTAILRAAGVLERKEAASELEPHAMTPEQLNRRIRELERRRTKLQSETTDDVGVFE